jgi:hypothetical protein
MQAGVRNVGLACQTLAREELVNIARGHAEPKGQPLRRQLGIADLEINTIEDLFEQIAGGAFSASVGRVVSLRTE